jgi:prepilin peptidase CpaA
MDPTLQSLALAAVSVAAVTDLASQRVPNWLTLPVAALALVLHLSAAGAAGALDWVAGLGAGFGLLIGFYALGGMGAGDVKLMAAVGACLGASNALYIFLLTSLLGGLYAIGLLLASRGVRSVVTLVIESGKALVLTGTIPGKPLGDGPAPRLCYAVCIAAATFVVSLSSGDWVADILTAA